MEQLTSPTNSINREISKNWTKIVTKPASMFRLDIHLRWCDNHKSNGRYYDNWIKEHNLIIEWFFEYEEDAVLFSLTWL